jgi:Abortive infection C-terminus
MTALAPVRSLHAELYGDRSSPLLVEEDLANLKDAASIRGHLTRIRDAAGSDPELAIGTAKDLIESTAKVALRELGVSLSGREDLPQLCKMVQKQLALHPTSLAPTTRGRDAVVRVLGGLAAIATGVDELRNTYGTGHGRAESVGGLGERHAQLAVDAASTYCRMVLATLADPEAPWRTPSVQSR